MPDASSAVPVPRRSLVWKAFATLVTAVSLAWVGWLLMSVWPELASHRADIRLDLLLVGTTLSIFSAYLTFEAFVALVRIFGISGLPRLQLAHLHFTAQLLKHLPGRIWGIGYQWTYGKAAGSLGDWLLVNIAHMALVSYFAVGSALFVLGVATEARLGILAATMGVLFYITGWLLVSANRSSQLAARIPGRAGRLLHELFELLKRAPWETRIRVMMIFLLSWLIYYASWYLYGLSYPPLGGHGGIRLCAYYMLAWLAGYLALLTPSGLGVRELVFAWLAKDFSGDSVALMAVVGRVSLLSVDVVLGCIFAPFVPRRP